MGRGAHPFPMKTGSVSKQRTLESNEMSVLYGMFTYMLNRVLIGFLHPSLTELGHMNKYRHMRG